MSLYLPGQWINAVKASSLITLILHFCACVMSLISHWEFELAKGGNGKSKSLQCCLWKFIFNMQNEHVWLVMAEVCFHAWIPLSYTMCFSFGHFNRTVMCTLSPHTHTSYYHQILLRNVELGKKKKRFWLMHPLLTSFSSLICRLSFPPVPWLFYSWKNLPEISLQVKCKGNFFVIQAYIMHLHTRPAISLCNQCCPIGPQTLRVPAPALQAYRYGSNQDLYGQ